MSLAHIKYPNPGRGGIEEWAIKHYAQHRAIVSGLLSQLNVNVPVRMIYPVDWNSEAQIAIFLEQHQSMHNDMNGPLNIPGNDLSNVDFKSKKQADAFYELNYFEHLAAVTNLGLPL